MTRTTRKLGSRPDDRRILALVADGRLRASEAARLLGGAGRPQAEERMDIAIIGIAGRFADCPDIEAYWAMLRDGRSAIRPMPAERDLASAGGQGRRVPKGGFIPDALAFDPGFFRISPTEAALMDPQQRLFLEQAYLALEDAGLGGDALSEARCGVYVGAGSGDYAEILKHHGVNGNPLALMGNVPSILAARISYFLNLKGPSLSVDTACSSSLVALHLAAESLRRGEVDLALAGGVCVINTPEFLSAMAEGGMLSPSDTCHTFDAGADGFVAGEAAAALVLKPLDRALAGGDRIWGVIKASGTNQDGRTNGITAPSGTAQESLEAEVYERFGIEPRTIGYVEAHGTGTPLGDPIEVDALTSAFRRQTQDRGFCRIGSVKTNIGHALTAAGVAGVIKVLLQMRHGVIAPSLNFETANPRIDFTAGPFLVADTASAWPATTGTPRRAAVSSFGFSGTNAHVVIDEAPAPPQRMHLDAGPMPDLPFLLSARSEPALKILAASLAAMVRDDQAMTPEDIAFSLAIGRGRFSARAGFLARDHGELVAGLSRIAREGAARDSTAAGTGEAERALTDFLDGGTLEPPRGLFGPDPRRVTLPPYPYERVTVALSGPATHPAAVPDPVKPGSEPPIDPTALERHAEGFAAVEAWARGPGLREAMDRLGLFRTGRAAFTRAWARRTLSIQDNQRRLFDAVLDMLARTDVIDIEGDVIRTSANPGGTDGTAPPAKPEEGPVTALAEAALAGLPDVLTGRRSALEILFPGGSGDLVERVYAGNPLADHLNRLLADQVEIGARHWSPAAGEPLRVLEVGAGTGAASRGVLARLASLGRPVDYIFSDVARAFVEAARATLDGHGAALRFEVFDLETEPGPAITGHGPFDIVIASNVLHATRRIAPVLRRLHALMAPGGRLILNEVARVQDFATLTFGLTDGWWGFEDGETRLPGSPLLSPAGWRQCLAEAGFPTLDVSGIPEDDPAQAILAATRDAAPSQLQPTRQAPEAAPPPGRPEPVPDRPETPHKPGRQEGVEPYLTSVLAQVLTMSRSDIDRRGRFMDYGLDSILGVSLVGRLNDDLGLDLRPTVVFDHPTVADLAEHLRALGAEPTASAAAPSTGMAQHPAADPGNRMPPRDDRIAVIGLSARFADADDLEAFQAMLRDGRNAVTEVPASRWTPETDPQGEPDPFQRWGGFLPNAEGFDPLALRMSGKEAELTDPQHRVFLMQAWHALEDAGYGEAALDGLRCGIYVGAHGGDYTHRMTENGVEPQAFAFMGNAASILAGRMAYMLNLKGPAMALDTACSSSLVSIHVASRALLDGECDMALAGGVFINTTRGFNVAAGKAGMLSPNGRCATFDAAADGFVPGEGCGVVVLKPLAKAIADGDHVEAVILGSGVNQDGKTNGITAPSPESQAVLMREVHARFAIDPASIGYVETHGTGTPLGDPIEIEGLTRAWNAAPASGKTTAIGSVKTNVGHAAHAAGIAGFIKAVLSLRGAELYPSLHYERENPALRLSGTPFRVQTALQPWHPEGGARRRAAVSSFGFSGTNCHVVLEQAPEPDRGPVAPGPRAILLSAKTPAALERIRERLRAHLEVHKIRLDDLSRTLAVGRVHMECRWACLAASVEEARDRLADSGSDGGGTDGSRQAPLITAFLAGDEIDPSGISPDGRHVSLPPYPFELSPYWIEEKPASEIPGTTVERRDTATTEIPLTLMAPRWRDLPALPEPRVSGTLAVVGAEPDLLSAIEAAWTAAGGDAVIDGGDDGVELGTQADAVTVLGTGPAGGPWRGEDTGRLLLDGVQRILKSGGSGIPVLVVHDGAPLEAALVSFGRSIAFLGGRAHVRGLKVPRISASAAAIVAELSLGVEGPREVVHENGLRRARHIEPVDLGGSTALPPLPDQAVCVITGGGGVLARALGLWLARTRGARVALVGRGPESGETPATIATIAEAGGACRYWTADVADEGAMARTIEAIRSTFGPIDAAFHLAGGASTGVVTGKTWDDMRDLLGAKARGLAVLDGVLADEPLSAFVVFSSLASELGDFGQCDYALANAYADRFVAWREARRTAGERQGKATSIDWPLWAEGRQVLSEHGADVFSQTSGLPPLPSREGFAALTAAMASDEHQVAVFTADPDTALRMVADVKADDTRRSLAPRREKPGPDATATDPTAVEAALTAMIAREMKLPPDRLPVDTSLADFGFDSISLKSFAIAISAHFGITVSPAVFFAHGTIRALAAYLVAEGAVSASALPSETASPDPARAPVDATPPPASSSPEETGRGGRAVAIIGMDGRFPGSPDPSAFWENLEAGRDLVGPMPVERLDWGVEGAENTAPGGFLDGADRFDHGFFQVTARDAFLMDPQHRLAIETVWNALETAGLPAGGLSGRRVGVFMASQINEYAGLIPFDAGARAQVALGNIPALLANRISFLFDFRGPSEAIDTACSSSLVAVHRAVQAIRGGEAELAVAGGVSLMLSPDGEETVRHLNVASSDHRCHVFDAAANGYVKGEGVGAVVLKDLGQACADGDPIVAVIRGSAVGHGGHGQTITAPNPAAQAEVIRRALDDAAVPAGTIGYVEAHGTGTELGDPVEIEGLKTVFREAGRTGPEPPCLIGSVKSNIGHLEPAAGIAGLLKVVQALRHKLIPPTIHFHTLNPLINLADSPIRIAERPLPWRAGIDGAPRRAGLSSFGFGGVNAHLVLEEAPAPAPAQEDDRATLIVLSAGDRDRLASTLARLRGHLVEIPLDPVDIAWTLMTGRTALASRIALVWRPGQELATRLTAAEAVLAGGGQDAAGEIWTSGDGTASAALAEDGESNALIVDLVASGALGRVARLWVAGGQFDWSRSGLPAGRRVTLPGYRFAGPRLWFKGRPNAEAGASGQTSGTGSGATPGTTRHIEPLRDPGEAPAFSPSAPTAPPIPAPAVTATTPALTAGTRAGPGAAGTVDAGILDQITRLVAEALYVEPGDIDITAGLADLGLDSILAVELVHAINAAFGTELEAARLYDHPTVEALARHLSSTSGTAAPAVTTPASAEHMPPASTTATGPAPAPLASSGTSDGAVFEEIRRIVAEALYIDPIDMDETASFGDLGLDSILAVEVVKTINDRFAVTLEAARLYDYPSIAALTRGVEALRAGASDAPSSITRPAVTVPGPQTVVGTEPNGGSEWILDVLRKAIAEAVGAEPSSIDPGAPLSAFPINPEAAAAILDALTPVLGFRPGLDVVGRSPNLAALSVTLAEQRAGLSHVQPTAPPPEPAAMAAPVVPVTVSPVQSSDPTDQIQTLIASALDVPAADIALDVPLRDLGLDLVQAGEIAFQLNQAHGSALRARGVLEARSIIDLAALLSDGPTPPDRPTPPPASPPTMPAVPAPRDPAAGPVPDRSAPATADGDGVAIIGLACRFPGAKDAETFWRNIRGGIASITGIPVARWDADSGAAALETAAQRSAARWGGFIDDFDCFDPLFFGLSPKEAEVMDPQQRIFLEEAWHALEDAGQTRGMLAGVACGVFVGGGQSDYVHHLPRDGADLSGQMLLGNTSSILAARIAYFLDLKGPSLAIDTACSSGLVATHYAAQSIRDGECDMALAGGISLTLSPRMHVMTAASGMLAPDGRCKTFDDDADGFVPGEGVGLVVLKRLSTAIEDGDRIYAVLSGTAVNQDGRTSSITAPSAASQTRLESGLYQRLGIDPGRIGYVEAHGTGTKLGDPIEIAALSDAFGPGADRQACAIGSVKTNIGHTLAAAGSAGLIKAVLSLHHRELAPSLNFSRANSHIRFEASPFRVQTAPAPWPEDRPLAAVSSFGFSGTNAHAVLAPAPVMDAAPAMPSGPWPIVLSAPARGDLVRSAETLADWLEAPDRVVNLNDLAHTLARRRTAFKHRSVLWVSDQEDLIQRLRDLAAGGGGKSAGNPDALAPAFQAFLDGTTVEWGSEIPAGAVISLPGYPFRRRRFWIEAPEPVQRNADGSGAVCVTVTIDSEHPVAAGHVVAGQALLPGVAALQIARAIGRDRGWSDWIEVTNLDWLRPVPIDGPTALEVSHAADDGAFAIEADGVPRVTADLQPVTRAPEDAIDLDHSAMTAVDGDALYRFLAESGLAYGAGFRRVEAAHVSAERALARLTAEPTGIEDGPLDSTLIGLLDAALHAIAAFAVARGDGGHGKLLLPASVERAQLGPALSETRWVEIRLRDDRGSDAVRVDVRLGNPAGRVVGRVQGLRALPPAPATRSSEVVTKPAETGAGQAKTFLLAPYWRLEPALVPASDDTIPGGTIAVLCTEAARDWADALVRDLRAAGCEVWLDDETAWSRAPDTVLFCAWGDGASPNSLAALADAEAAGVQRLLSLSRSLIADGRRTRLRVVTRGVHAVAAGDETDASFAALAGFTRTLAREHPNLDPVVIDLPALALSTPREEQAYRNQVLREPGAADGVELAYRGDRRYARRFSELDLAGPTPSADTGPFRAGGTYLILGGAGGIGRAVSLDLAERYRARVAWVGRRPFDTDIEGALEAVRRAGGEAEYHRADATVPADLTRAVKTVESAWGPIDGVIHATIVLADQRIETMDTEGLAAALHPKSRTAMAIASAFRDRQPGFLAVFSSSNAFTCNPGQANYAAGCTFIDAWARSWGAARDIPVTVINWGFWGETGIVASAAYRERAIAAGVDPMSTREGLDLFHRLVSGRVDQAAVMRFAAEGASHVETDVTRVLRPAPSVALLNHTAAAAALASQPNLDDAALRQAAEELPALEEYARRRLLDIMSEAGVLTPGTWTVAECADAMGVVPGYRGLFAALLEILSRSGALVMRGRSVTISAVPSATGSGPDITAPTPRRLAAHLRLLDTCLEGLPDILRGRRNSVEVMFPGGSPALVEAVYRGNPASDLYNALLAACASGLAARAGPPLSILEIGAGTGGATVALVERLRADGIDFRYRYTDVTPRFLEAGRALFTDEPAVEYAVLDIDRDPTAQGFEAGEYDIVIASNVLHAAQDIDLAIDHAKALLRRDGALLLNEMTARSDMASLTFGLTEGWWAFTDPEQRLAYTPLLDRDGWRTALHRAGFLDTIFDAVGDGGGQSIILARGDGWLPRRRGLVAAPKAPEVRSATGAKADPRRSTASRDDQAALARQLRGIFAEALKMDVEEIDPSESYEVYGVDSLIAMELCTRLEPVLGPIEAASLFEGGSINGLATQLANRIETPPAVATATADDVPSDPARPAEPHRLPHPALSPRTAEPIAVIGMAGRYPGGGNEEAFWQTLDAGDSLARPIPPERWALAGIDPARVGDDPGAALIEDVACFDPLFFQIAPAEAAAMDPQERLFLQTAWEALENAAVPARDLGGPDRRVGVYVGAMRGDYERLGTRDFANGGAGLAGSPYWSIANRVSHFCDFRGPSMALDTACSASLAAIQMACEHLASGRIDAALAGGVHLILDHQARAAMARMGMLSPDGRARPFAVSANGMVEGEGVGAVVLKRLSDALRDGDRPRAVILGAGIGAVGRSGGYMIPSPKAEADLISEALNRAGIAPDAVDYVEAQASGSPVGDPVELQALQTVFGNRQDAIPVGTMKGVTGHLSSASGIAQLAKVILQLENQRITGFSAPGDKQASGLRFAATGEAWPKCAGKNRIALVNAFGAGGSDVVLVVAEPPDLASPASGDNAGPYILPLSARTPEALRRMAEHLADRLAMPANEGEESLARIAWTLQTGREDQGCRLALIAEERGSASRALADFLAGRPGGWRAGRLNGTTLGTPAPEADPEAIAEAWSKGARIDWRQHWRGTPPRPVGLPSYPFERRRCWIDLAPVHATEAPPSRGIDPQDSPDMADPTPPATRRAVLIDRVGDLDDLVIRDVPAHPPGPDDVVIAVEAFALNFGDLLSLRGSYPNLPPYPFVPGSEVAGRLVWIGENVAAARADLTPGTPVAALTGGQGGQADHVTVPGALTIALPPNLGMARAAAFPIGYLTAKHALDRAALLPGERVLITSAGGGVGPFLVQMASNVGAKVFVTAGSPEKIEMLRRLGVTAATLHPDAGLARWVEEAGGNDKTEIDVVVNLLGGAAIQEGLDLLAPGGRYVEIALSGLMAQGRLDFSRFVDNQSFIAVNLGRVLASEAQTAAALTDLAAAMRDGRIEPVIDSTLPFARIREGYARLAERRNVGKVVITMDDTVAESAVVQDHPDAADRPAPAHAGAWATIEAVTAPVAAVLGLAQSEVEPDADLADLGLTSVSGLEIARRLSDLAGTPVPVTMLWQDRSIGALVSRLNGGVSAGARAGSLRTLRADGDHPPVFLVHGAPGEVSWAVDLALRLGDGIPVHAFEAPGLSDDRATPPAIEDLAASYADELHAVHPTGRFWLGGYSGGGAIAFEMARRLRVQGREPEGLLLLDANAPGTESLKHMRTVFTDGFIHHLAANWFGARWGGKTPLAAATITGPEAAHLSEDQRLDRVLDHLFTTATPPVGRDAVGTMIRRMDRVARALGEALAHYAPDPLAAPLRAVLFRCERGMAPEGNPLSLTAFESDGDYRDGWSTLLAGEPEPVSIDCDHFSLVLDPHAGSLATALRRTITGASGDPDMPASAGDTEHSRALVEKTVIEAIHRELIDVPLEAIDPNLSMTDLGATSLDRVEVTMAAMDSLGLDIRPRDLVGLENINALIDVLHDSLRRREDASGRQA